MTPLANAYLTEEETQLKEPVYPLKAYICSECLLVQSPSLHQPDEIFSEYAYFSSYSSSWLEHARTYAEMVIERFQLTSQSQVVEIGSNDGYLLQFFQQRNIPVLGIEPAKNVAQIATDKGISTVTEFFGTSLVKNGSFQADLLIANNVLAHVPN